MVDELIPTDGGRSTTLTVTSDSAISTPSAASTLRNSNAMRRVLHAPATLPVVLTAALMVWHIARPALWADELATNGAVTLPWGPFFRLLGSVDIVLAPYYVLMHVWVQIFGASEVSLRLPSAIAVVAAVAVTSVLGARLYGRWAGFLAGMLLAILPSSSRVGQEARPYALAMFFGVLATYLLVRFVDAPTVARRAGYTAALAMTALLHSVASMIVISHGVVISGRRSRRSWAIWMVAALVPAITLFGWEMRYEKATVSWIPVITFQSGISEAPWIAGGTGIGTAVLALCVIAADRSRTAIAVACYGLLPAVILVTAGQALPVWDYKYCWFMLPGTALLAAYGLRRVSVARGLAVIVLIATLGYTEQLTIRGPAGHGQASREIDTIIGPRFVPGDVAVYANNHPTIPWSPRDVVARYLPADRTPTDILAMTQQRQDGHLLALEHTDVAACLSDVSRVWVIRADRGSPSPISGLDGTKTVYLEDNFTIVQTWRYPLLTVALLLRTTPPTASIGC